MKRMLLQLPGHCKYNVSGTASDILKLFVHANLFCCLVFLPAVPESSDLSRFPVLTGDLGMWRKHILMAAQKDSSVKQRLASSLIAATHSTGMVLLPWLHIWSCYHGYMYGPVIMVWNI